MKSLDDYPVKQLREMPTLLDRDVWLEWLWSKLEDAPMDPETEKLETDFYFFKKGTDKEDIWHWFDERYTKGVHYLLYGGYGDQLSDYELRRREEKCDGCGKKSCAYCDDGTCRYALVFGKTPEKYPVINNDSDDCCDEVCDGYVAKGL
jgi:hypothetical protein